MLGQAIFEGQLEGGKMKKRLLAFLCLTWLSSWPAPAWGDFVNLNQQPPTPQASIKILTLNVMQQAAEPRGSRFQRLADFLVTDPVHLLALQELSGGPYDTPPTQDSGADLANLLANAGLSYGYYTEANWGYPPYLVFKVGVLPRYRMLATAAAHTGTPADCPPFDTRRNVVMCGVEIPGFGRINLYSVHIYTPAVETLETQIDNLMQFVEATDAANPAAACIVAGDLNFTSTSNPVAYQKLLDHGFVDSYARAHCAANPAACCGQAGTGGCTFAAPDNPFAEAGAAPSRIDYLLVRGRGLHLRQSKVVFNGVSEDFVSDHSAVLTEISRKSTGPVLELLLVD